MYARFQITQKKNKNFRKKQKGIIFLEQKIGYSQRNKQKCQYNLSSLNYLRPRPGCDQFPQGARNPWGTYTEQHNRKERKK